MFLSTSDIQDNWKFSNKIFEKLSNWSNILIIDLNISVIRNRAFKRRSKTNLKFYQDKIYRVTKTFYSSFYFRFLSVLIHHLLPRRIYHAWWTIFSFSWSTNHVSLISNGYVFSHFMLSYVRTNIFLQFLKVSVRLYLCKKNLF